MNCMVCGALPPVGSLLCDIGEEDTPRWVSALRLHRTECQTLGVTLKFWVVRRYNLGEKDLLGAAIVFSQQCHCASSSTTLVVVLSGVLGSFRISDR